MSNIIRIKRRLPDSLETGLPVLQSGELAFNEISKTLFYGASGVSGTEALAIGGEGVFATNSLVASLTADLQSEIGSSNSAIESLSSQVDTIISRVDQDITDTNTRITNLSSDVDDIKSDLDQDLTDVNTRITNLSSDADEKFVLKAGDTITGSLTIQGDLSVLGATTTIETDVTTTSAFSITNYGSQTALTVTQVDGNTDVAEFIDGDESVLIIKGSGNVGIGTTEPAEKLTVSGNISASGNGIFGGSLEIGGGAESTSLFVGENVVGVNTETPNEALTVVGSISATGDLYVTDITATTLDVDSGSIGTVEFDNAGNITNVLSMSATGGSGTLYGFTLDGGEF
jgi:hypothetical protein